LNERINIRQLFYFILALIVIFACGLNIDVMDVDAAQYASMAREMSETGNYLEVTNRYHDYLDKPPLLFWLSSFSFGIFGIHNWAYKLPSFLFGLLAIWSTYGLGKLLYSKQTGAVAALMLASCTAIFIVHNDIRTDTMLIGAVVFSIWQLQLWVRTKSWWNLLFGFAGIGVAMLAKGPLGFMMPALALSSEFAYKRQWRNFFRWQWLIGLAIIALILLPMCLGLYRQHGPRGLYFYFWEQSFGRLTGDSPWGTKFDNGAGPFFFVHTFLWVFLPWSVLFVFGLWKNFVVLLKSRFREGFLPEALSTGGFVLTFIALSASKYKLPHYIYVTLPLASLIAARFLLQDVLPRAKPWLFIVFRALFDVLALALFAATGVVLFVIFGIAPWYLIVLCALFFAAAICFRVKKNEAFPKLLYPLLFAVMAAYAAGNLHFYPQLLRYQSTSVAGKMVTEANVPPGAFVTYHDLFEHSMDFYSRRAVQYIHAVPRDLDSLLRTHSRVWIYTDEQGEKEIRDAALEVVPDEVGVYKKHYELVESKRLPHFSVQFLTIPFLDPRTREERLRWRYLVTVKK